MLRFKTAKIETGISQYCCKFISAYFQIFFLILIIVSLFNFRMMVKPNEICVIQQGIKFSIAVSGPTRGYLTISFSFSCSIQKLHLSDMCWRFMTIILFYLLLAQLAQMVLQTQGKVAILGKISKHKEYYVKGFFDTSCLF